MNKLFVKLMFFTLLATPLSSWALFEARATYGLLTSKQDIKDVCQGSCTNSSNAPGVLPTVGLGLDALVKLPLFPIGFGARYENMGLKGSANGIEADLKYTRTALLLNYRLIDTIVHFGPIASYGLTHSGSMTVKENGATRVDFSATKMTSYSIGLELEVKPLVVIPLIVGAEAGYMGFKWDDVTNSVDNTTKSLDLSGYYMKVFLGIDI